MGREGADAEGRRWRGVPAPHPDMHFFPILGKTERRGAGGGGRGGASRALASTARRRGINRCVKCRFALGRGGQEEKGFLRGASFILPARSLLMKPSTWGLSPQQGSEEQTPPALRANTRGSGRSGAGSRRSPPPPTSQSLPLPIFISYVRDSQSAVCIFQTFINTLTYMYKSILVLFVLLIL